MLMHNIRPYLLGRKCFMTPLGINKIFCIFLGSSSLDQYQLDANGMKSRLSERTHISKSALRLHHSQAVLILKMSKLKINFYGNKITVRQPSLSTELLIPVNAP